MSDQEVIDSLSVTSVATGGKLTYDDVLKAQEAIGKMKTGRPTLVYHPTVICKALKAGVMREDEDGRIWTVVHSFPAIHNIEVFASEEVDETVGFFVDNVEALYVGKR